MSLKIRLARGGTKKRPHYRIVIADSRSPRDGRFIERVGIYDPMLPKEHSGRVTIKEDRIRHWLSVGAKPSDRVGRLLSAVEIVDKAVIPEQTKKNLPKAKALERMKEAAADALETGVEDSATDGAELDSVSASDKPVSEALEVEVSEAESTAETAGENTQLKGGDVEDATQTGAELSVETQSDSEGQTSVSDTVPADEKVDEADTADDGNEKENSDGKKAPDDNG